MLELNVTSMTLLTSALLPPWSRAGAEGSSTCRPASGSAYCRRSRRTSRRKHYVTGLTEALYADLARHGGRRDAGLPGSGRYEFEGQLGNYTGAKVPSFIEQTPQRCARAAIRGFDRGRAMVLPGLLH